MKSFARSLALAAGSAINNPNERFADVQKNMTKLLEQIKYHSFDYGMQDCYKVHVIETPIMNAFNIGCNIFISIELIHFLNSDPDQLRAVLAHELAHGDRGHGIKTFSSLIAAGVKELSLLTLDQMLWLATGSITPHLHATEERGVFILMMERFGSTAPAIEKDADSVAAQILLRAGYSPQSLISALKNLYSISGDVTCEQTVIKGRSTFRDYPSFCERKEAIEK